LIVSACTGALAQAWPDRPIRWIVPYPAGGGTDVVARAVADQLSQSLRQPVVVDNRAGGNTIIGTGAVAQATPDGNTIGLITDAFSANIALAR
jgi:tripartite-type tricarboxylate transporter receptor subunit TctC